MSLSNNTFMISSGQQSTRQVGTWLSQVSAGLHHLRAYWTARRARARELRELYRCSDRELWDMGLSRSDFLAIEKGTFRRD
jgi:uncharacterized protein YjiS (DUF1127 family)